MNDNIHFFNRELSWLEFNERVLNEAQNKTNPLLERLKFLAIVSSNLDEFFMVRVASLKELVNAGFNKSDPAGLSPKQQLKQISVRAQEMEKDKYSLYNRILIPRLKEHNLNIISKEDLTDKQGEWLEEYFDTFVYPVLTPLAVDASRPFPLILNKSLNIGVFIKNNDLSKDYIFSSVQVPSVLPRIVELPSFQETERTFILLEEIILKYIKKLFAGNTVLCCHPYRIIRNTDLNIDEDEADDLLREIELSIKKRKWGQAVRLEVDKKMNNNMVDLLKNALEIHYRDIFYINGPLDLTFLMKLYSLEDLEHLKYPEYYPQIPSDLLEEDDIFEAIRKKDILLHHPYESFEPIVNFVKKAAHDPKVLAIKQTLYRVSGKSPIIEALAEAAENGKQVTVLVEVKARFDEENNIQWAKKLEQAGCHVIYGLVGLKTHGKIILVVRLEDEGIKRYIHLGTGNYNDFTAKIYTDFGFFTCNEHFGADASALFNMLSGYSELPELNKLILAPKGLREKLLELIHKETSHALLGKSANIIVKMNSLVDSEIIESLYAASQAGVKISLIIRGICCLKPGIPGLSENITVTSIVGRFLEHTRIFFFSNNNQIYLSSADWMPRNLNRRVEILFPIEDLNLKERLIDILYNILSDNVKAKSLQPDGKYKKIDKRGKIIFSSQDYFIDDAINKVKTFNKEKLEGTFQLGVYERRE